MALQSLYHLPRPVRRVFLLDMCTIEECTINTSVYLRHAAKKVFFRRNNFGCFFYIYFCLRFKLRHSKYNPWGVRGCSDEGTRLPPMWPGFKSRRRRHMWVEFVAGSLPCSERFFSGYSGFPLYEIPTLSNSSSCWNARKRFNEFLELLNAPWVNKLQILPDI